MLEIRLLGEQRVTLDGVMVDALRSTRALELLSYLIVHAGAPQVRQHLAGMFWPDSADAQARTNLRRELHQLRAAIPDPERCLVVDDKTVCWREDAPWPVDVITFRQAAAEAKLVTDDGDSASFAAAAQRAVDAYGGDLLAGFYNDWVLDERERLHRECVALTDRLIATCDERGETETAIGYARRLVELEPLEESGYQALMRLQVRIGDRAGALRTYHRCSSALERELGVRPSPQTVSVYEQLVVPRQATSGPLLSGAAPLVGRDRQLAALRDRLWSVLDGPRLVVIAGEAGVGKSRLVAEFAAEAERGGATVARARCFASQGRLALAPVAGWLRTPVLRRAVESLGRVWRAEVARLVPEQGTSAGRTRSDPLSDAWQRRRFFEGLARAILAADPPTVLVLDDLQWCDAETLAWLELLLHLEPNAPLLVIATLRIEELTDQPDLAAWCRRLRQADVLRQLDLAPLSAGETRELAQALSGTALDEVAVRKLARMTGGFPLFVVESLREGSADSARIEAVLAGRLASLAPAAEELAGVAAAVGRDFSLDLLAFASGLADEELVDALDELWRRRLLREHSPATYDFTHDLLRDAAYERLAPPHRRLLHRRVAAALEHIHADGLDVVAAQLAEQYELGGQTGQAVRCHQVAAQAAADVFAHDDTVQHYERALGLLADLPAGDARDRQEATLLESMVAPLVALRGYGSPRLGRALERMTDLGAHLADDTVVVRSEAARFSNLFVQGRIYEASTLADRLASRADQRPEQQGELWVTRGFGLTSLGRLDEALRQFAMLEENVDAREVSPLGFPIKVMARSWQAKTLWLAGEAERATACSVAAITLAEELEHPFGQALAQGYAAITHLLLGDVERTVQLATSVQEMCARYDFAYYGEWGRILEGWAIGGTAGEARVRDGLDRLKRQHAGRARPFWLSLLAEVLIHAGRQAEADQVLADAISWAERYGDRWWLAEVCRLDAALQTGEAAEPMLERARTVASEQGAVALELRAATDLAGRWVDGGRSEQARELLGSVRARAGRCNAADVAAADALLAAAEA